VNYKQFLLPTLKITKRAGNAILKIYNTDFAIEQKEDNSPITIADKKSQEIIIKGLKKITPELPILSEESKKAPYNERTNWKIFWLVDPLDGTKEFIKRNGEFAVNIALIKDKKPVLGIIHIPDKDLFYFAYKEIGSYKLEDWNKLNRIRSIDSLLSTSIKLPQKSNELKYPDRPFTVVTSRSHLSKRTKEYIEKLKNQSSFRKASQQDELREGVSHQQGKRIPFPPNDGSQTKLKIIPVGSSLKMCLVVEGKADIYPRFGKTYEWDIAAGQAIVESSGGKVINIETKKTLEYNKQNLANPSFIVYGQKCVNLC